MSRKLLAFLLSELNTVRIVCKKCRTAVEMTAEQVGGVTEYNCLGCRTTINAATALKSLAAGMGNVKSSDLVEVEFVVPDPAGR